jgi:hypothetical protein
MTAWSNGPIFGHDAQWEEGDVWRFSDTGEPANDENIRARKCPVCQLSPSQNMHDPCIADLPGVRNACCGHGRPKNAYVQFDDRRELRRGAALSYFDVQKVGPGHVAFADSSAMLSAYPTPPTKGFRWT